MIPHTLKRICRRRCKHTRVRRYRFVPMFSFFFCLLLFVNTSTQTCTLIPRLRLGILLNIGVEYILLCNIRLCQLYTFYLNIFSSATYVCVSYIHFIAPCVCNHAVGYPVDFKIKAATFNKSKHPSVLHVCQWRITSLFAFCKGGTS